MRIAVMSDIHGNRVALAAALEDMKKRQVDQVVCLGDTVQGGAQPTETVSLLRATGCPTILGNADAWLLKGEGDTTEQTTKEQREVRRWTLSKLSPDDIAFVRNYRPTLEVALDHTQRLLCFHGSPTSYDDVLLPDTPNQEWDRLLGPFSPAIMAGGHTHTQQTRRVKGGFFFNPGSIGIVYDYHLPKSEFRTEPWAEYAILTHEDGRSSLEFLRTRYDLDELVHAIRSSGRPHAENMINDYLKGNR